MKTLLEFVKFHKNKKSSRKTKKIFLKLKKKSFEYKKTICRFQKKQNKKTPDNKNCLGQKKKKKKERESAGNQKNFPHSQKKFLSHNRTLI